MKDITTDTRAHQMLVESLQAIERLELELERARAQPRVAVAIVGVGCRLPGAESPIQFWDMLCAGTDAIEPIPADRWDVEAFSSATPAPGRMQVRTGGFVPHLRAFDAEFFGISPREARALDPQQRLLLEVVWETLEHAARSAESLRDTRTGVYLGLCSNDYQQMLVGRDVQSIDAYMSSGTCHSTAAGRISYWLGLKGPSLAIDTACSSSLVAMHLACRSIQSGECDQAFVGGVNRIISPHVHINFTQAGMLAVDGRCKAFSAAADGFARAEGCGVALLKRLDHAERDGDRILAIIAGSAVNQDGRSAGLTVPNGPAQQAVIRAAINDADLRVDDIGYLEAHGTGTALGDPIEIESLSEVFAATHAVEPLLIGSVKTNIGHLEAAAGIAGVIKVTLALLAKQVPAHLHFHQPSPHIDWVRAPVRVVDTLQPWPQRNGRRIAGISSFGFSGTNAHIILREASAAAQAAVVTPTGPILLPVSARSPAALAKLCAAYADAVESCGELGKLRNLAASAATRRDALPWRHVAAGRDAQALANSLRCAPATGKALPQPRIAFLFTGQGSQHAQMAKALAAVDRGFAEDLHAVCAIASAECGIDVAQWLLDDVDSRLSDTRYAQVALCALQLALVRMLARHGVRATATLGHSVGEIAALCAAGAISEPDALRFAHRRGTAMSALAAEGGMVAVLRERAFIDELLGRHPRLELAACNAPDCHVLAGAVAAISLLTTELDAAGIAHTRLATTRAFHTASMDAALPAISAAGAEFELGEPDRIWISSCSGRRVNRIASDYWSRQAREPVQFAEALKTLADQRIDAYVEIGPGQVLIGLLRRCGQETAAWAISAGRERAHETPVYDALGGLFQLGCAVDWRAHFGGRGPVLPLPSHPFKREVFWPDEDAATLAASATHQPSLSQVLERAGLNDVDTSTRKALQRLYAAMTGTGERFDDAMHGLRWLPNATLEAPAVALVEPTILAKAHFAVSHQVIADYRVYESELEALAAVWVASLWRKHGMLLGDWSFDAMAAQLQLLGKYRRLLSRLLQILESSGYLQRAGDVWRGQGLPSLSDLEIAQCVASFTERFGRRVEFRLLERCATDLGAVLDGRSNPVHLLFPNGDFGDTAELYRDGPVLRTLNRSLCSWLRELVTGLTPGVGLRVLEVGAGTGGTTVQVLDALASTACEYWFTDVGASFVARAREEFSTYDFLRFGVFDLEAPNHSPVAAGSCDVVIAANVLHATRDIRASVSRAAAQLKPGGWLALVEGTAAQSWVDLTFGLTDGWWCFDGDPWRSSYPLLAEAEWRALLTELGFVSFEVVTPYPGCSQRLILARLGALQPARPVKHLLHGADALLLQRVARALQADGAGGVEAITLDDVDSCRRALAAAGANTDFVVHQLIDARGATNVEASCLELSSLIKVAGALAPTATIQVDLIGESALNDPAANAVAAFARVASLERGLPGIRRVWLESDSMLHWQRALRSAEESLAPRESLWSAQGRLLLSLERIASSSLAEPQLRADARYVITGALGGVGLEVLRWMALQGARDLVLIGRAGVETPAQQEVMTRLSDQGVKLRVCELDLADATATEGLFAELREQTPAVHGILHLAGVIGPATLAVELDANDMHRVAAPKALGALHLHRSSIGMPLDFFVCFSSGAAVWGFKGQAHYAAANGYVDGLVRMRRSIGLPASTINWGFLAPGGMTASAESQAVLSGYGVHPLETADILRVLGTTISNDLTQIVAARNDWARLRELLASAGEAQLVKALVDDVDATAPIAAPPAIGKFGSDLRQQLLQVAPRKRAQTLEDALLKMLGGVLGRSEQARLAVDEGFQSLGVDSLMALELRRQVERACELSLPATMVYDFPNIGALARHLLPQLDDALSALPMRAAFSGASPPTFASPVNTSVASDAVLDELESLLERELKDLAG